MTDNIFSEYMDPFINCSEREERKTLSLRESRWLIVQDMYAPKTNLQYESLFCLTNGYLGTRGSYEEGAYRAAPAEPPGPSWEQKQQPGYGGALEESPVWFLSLF